MDNREIEKEEAKRLSGIGVDFAITYEKDVEVVGEGILGKVKHALGWCETERKVVTETYTINEPTLAVLDLLSAEFIGLDIEMEELTKGGSDSLTVAKRMVNKHARNAARVCAIATLGERCFNKTFVGYEVDKNAIEERTDTLLHAVKTSDLKDLCNIIIGVCNLGNFISSIALLSASRTTTAKTIE